MRTETACRMSCLLKRKRDSLASLKEHPFVLSMIFTGRVLCKVTPAMPTWGLSPETRSSQAIPTEAAPDQSAPVLVGEAISYERGTGVPRS